MKEQRRGGMQKPESSTLPKGGGKQTRIFPGSSNMNSFGGRDMAIEIRLKQVLEEHGLHVYGVESEIANACGVHRHTIGNLLRNRMKNPSLDYLNRVCRWLIGKGVPQEELPGALFAFRPPTLWKAIAGLNTRRNLVPACVTVALMGDARRSRLSFSHAQCLSMALSLSVLTCGYELARLNYPC